MLSLRCRFSPLFGLRSFCAVLSCFGSAPSLLPPPPPPPGAFFFDAALREVEFPSFTFLCHRACPPTAFAPSSVSASPSLTHRRPLPGLTRALSRTCTCASVSMGEGSTIFTAHACLWRCAREWRGGEGARGLLCLPVRTPSSPRSLSRRPPLLSHTTRSPLAPSPFPSAKHLEPASRHTPRHDSTHKHTDTRTHIRIYAHVARELVRVFINNRPCNRRRREPVGLLALWFAYMASFFVLPLLCLSPHSQEVTAFSPFLAHMDVCA